MNDVAMLCERVGADVDSVRKAMGADERIGQKSSSPGLRVRRELLPQGREGADRHRPQHRAWTSRCSLPWTR